MKTSEPTSTKDSRVARGSAAGVMLQLFHYATRFALTPLVIACIGFESYGFWALLFQILGLVGLHRIGLLSAAVTYVAQFNSTGKRESIGALLQTTSTAMAGIAVLAGGVLIFAGEPIVRMLGVPPAAVPNALLVLQWTTWSTLIALVLGGYQSALEGLQHHPRVRLVEGISSACEVALIVVLLRSDVGLPSLGYAYALRILLPLPCFAWLARRELPGLVALPIRLDRKILKDVLGFGGSIQLCGLIFLATATLERLSIAHLVSLHAAGIFELGRKLTQLAVNFPLQACAPLTAASASDPERGRALVGSSLRLLASVAIPGLFLLFAIPETILAIWIGEVPPGAALTLRALVASAYVHLCTGPLTAHLRGGARGRDELAYMMVWIGTSILIVPLAAFSFGLPGAVIGSALAQIIGCLSLFARSTQLFGISFVEVARDVIRPVLCSTPAGLWLAMQLFSGDSRMELLGVIAPHSALYFLFTLLLLWNFSLMEREREAIRSLASKVRARISPGIPPQLGSAKDSQ